MISTPVERRAFKLRDLKIWVKYPFLWHWLVNVAVAGAWFYYVREGLIGVTTTSFSFRHTAILLRNTSVTLLFLFRRPSRLTSRSVVDWVIAISGTFLSYFYVSGDTKPIFPVLVPAAYGITVMALFASTIAVLNLGRSFGIVPANRGIKTNGLYAVVRHPIYSFYIANDLGWNLLCSSMRNFSVFLAFCVVTYFRAKREESLLRQDPAYEEYALRTRHMFFPGII